MNLTANVQAKTDGPLAPGSVTVRPWGQFESVTSGDGYQIKRITVLPGQKLSLQMHHKRSEHWVIAAGEAIVTCADQVLRLKAGDHVFIPVQAKHRLANEGTTNVVVLEVQCGEYLGEDDIVRFDDIYGRS